MSLVVFRKAAVICGLAILLLLSAPVFATPSESKPIAQGSSVVLVVSDAALQVKQDPQLKGAAIVLDTPQGAKKHALVYVAPTSGGPFTESVQYSEASVEHAVSVDVRAEPPTLLSGELYERSFKALFTLFILATILESGLAVLFNWRVFLELFDARGMKTLASVAFAALLVWTFEIDIVTSLINVYTGANMPVNGAGKLITALVIAGGSSGVNRLMVALGFRAVKTADDLAPKPKPSEAWISVRVFRKDSVGKIDVMMRKDGKEYAVGTIAGSSRRWWLLAYFLRDFGRFPGYGGHSVDLDKPIQIWVKGLDKDGKEKKANEWGPHSFSAGTLLDLDFTL